MAVKDAGVEELGVISFNLHEAGTFVPTAQSHAPMYRRLEAEHLQFQHRHAHPKQLILRDRFCSLTWSAYLSSFLLRAVP